MEEPLNTYLVFFVDRDEALRIRADKCQEAGGCVVFTKDGATVAIVSIEALVYVVREEDSAAGMS